MTRVEQPAVPVWWQPLFAACPKSSIFLSSEWILTWLEIYGSEFDKLWVHWEVDDSVVGGCLLVARRVRVRSLPLYTVFLNASGQATQSIPLSEFNDVLHLAAHKSAIAADLAQLLNSLRWSRLALSGYEADGLIAMVIPLLHKSGMDCETVPAPYIDLQALPDRPYADTLRGRQGHKMRRNGRLYEKLLGTVSLVRAQSLAEALEFFSDLAHLNRLRWASRKALTTLASPAVIEFHRRLIERLWRLGHIDLVRVGSADKAVGFLYTFVMHRKVSFFQSGFHYGQDARLSPGLLTLAAAIDDYRRSGHAEFDFLAGEAPYKRALAKKQRELHWAIVYRNRPLMRVLLALRIVKNRVIGA